MEKSGEVSHVEDAIESTKPSATVTDMPTSEKDVPLVVKLAHENDVHIRLGWRSWMIISLTCVCLAAQVFVSTAAGQIMAFIIRDLGEPETAGWIIQGPLLMQSILSPTVGRLSDVLDRKWMASIPPLFAFAGAAISAEAKSMSMLIGASILIGLTLPTAPIIHAIQAEILPMKYRAVANGLSFLGVSIGSIIASLGSGALTDRSFDGWRNVFWLQAVFHGITALGFLTLYWPKAHPDYPKMSLRQLFWEIDPIGSFFFMGSCALLLIALNWAGGRYAWSDAHVAAPLAIGLVFLVCFALYEWKGRKDGLVSHIFFDSGPNFPLGVLGFTVEGWIFYSAVNSVTPQQILRLGFESNAFRISVRHLSYGLPGLAASMILTTWATKKKDLVRPLFVTFALFVVGSVCFATLNPTQNKVQIFYAVIIGVGQAGPLTLLVPLVQFTAPHSLLSTASGLAYSGRAIGGAFGSAVLNVIINNHLKAHLNPSISKAAVDAGLPRSSVPQLLKAMKAGTPKLLNAVPGINETILAAATSQSQWVYARAYNLSWWSIFPFAVLCTIGTLFLKGVKDLMTEKVEATVEQTKEQE